MAWLVLMLCLDWSLGCPSAFPVPHEIAQRPRIVEGVVRDSAGDRDAEAGAADKLEAKAAYRRHLALAGDEQGAEKRDVVGPVGDDDRFGLPRQVRRDLGRGGEAGNGFGMVSRRHRAEIGDDITLDPGMDLVRQRQEGIIFLIAMLGHESSEEPKSEL